MSDARNPLVREIEEAATSQYSERGHVFDRDEWLLGMSAQRIGQVSDTCRPKPASA
jgi:hypothetical protein